MNCCIFQSLMLLATLYLSGCINVVSRNPLYDPRKDRTFDSKLVGIWTDGDDITLEIKRGETSSYIALAKEQASAAEARKGKPPSCDDAECQKEPEPLPFDLVKFGSRRYIFPRVTFVQTPGEGRQPDEPAHAAPVAKLKRRGDTLYLRGLDADELLRIAQQNPGQLPHEWKPAPRHDHTPRNNSDPHIQINKGTLILNCTREQFQAALRKHDDALFHETKLTLKRVKKTD